MMYFAFDNGILDIGIIEDKRLRQFSKWNTIQKKFKTQMNANIY